MQAGINAYLKSMRIEGKSENSIKNYKIHLNNLNKKLQKKIENINVNDIREYLLNYQEERGICNRSLEAMRCCFNSFFKWAVANEYITKNPMENIKNIKFHSKPREGLSREEVKILREAAQGSRDRAILEFFLSTGCRVSEVAAIKKVDIDLDNNKVLVLGKGDKYRYVYLSNTAKELLLTYWDERHDTCEFAFVSKRAPFKGLHKTGLEALISRIAARTTIKKKITPHILRHTFATTALKDGLTIPEIQYLMGHSNIETTMIYAKIDKNDLWNKMNNIK